MIESTTTDDDPAAGRRPLPYLTDPQRAIGGRIKVECSDFVVEEIPAYEPCGEGEHLFLWVEKTDRSAEQLIAHVARALHVRRESIGMAGLKDRFAVTRQWISVPAGVSGLVSQIDCESFRVLRQARHRNKLHTAHNRGNRFDILVRGVVDGALAIAQEIAGALQQLGAPNYFGEQRFGYADETLSLGLKLLSGEATLADIPAPRRKFLSRLALSAVQAAVFNEVLARRIESGTLHTVRAGDVLQVVRSGGCFLVEDVLREQPRLAAREVVPTGPLFGPKRLAPQGVAADEELDALAAFGLRPEQFKTYPQVTAGARRPMLIWPEVLEIVAEPEGLRFRMQLPAGAYATVVLREFMKSDAFAPQDAQED